VNRTAPVTCLAVSPDGKRLASGSALPDTTVRLWDPTTGQELLTLPRHIADLTGVAFSPDGKRLATVNGVGNLMRFFEPETGKDAGSLNFNGTRSLTAVAYRPGGKQIGVTTRSMQVMVYEFATRRTNVLRGHAAHVYGLAFSLDGRRLASCDGDGEVLTWDADATPEAITLPTGGYCTRVAFSPDGRFLAWANDAPVGGDLKPKGPGEVRLADAVTAKELQRFAAHQGNSLALAFSPDGQWLASVGADRTIKVWETAAGRPLLELQADEPKGRSSRDLAVGFSADGKQLILASVTGVLRVWDLPAGRARSTRLPEVEAPWLVELSPDGRQLAVATLTGTVHVFDRPTGTQVGRLSASSAPTALAFRQDGRRLAVASGGGRSVSMMAVWDLEKAREVHYLSGHSQTITQLTFSPDGRRLASASWDRTLKVWDTEAGCELLTLAGHTHTVFGLAYSPDGRRLASASGDNTVKIWDGTPTREVFTVHRANLLVTGVAYSRNGQYLASVQGASRRACIWDPVNGRQLLSLGVSKGEMVGMTVAFRPDGRRVALGRSAGKNGGNLTIWELPTGALLHDFKAHVEAILDIAFTPDGRRLVSASHDKTVKIWDAADGGEVLTFRGHLGRVHALAVSPDGGRIASAGGDGTVKVWDAASGRIVLSLPAPRGGSGTLLFTSDLWTAMLNLRANLISMGGVAFSPDGKRLVSCSLGLVDANCQAIVWDATTGRQLQVFRKHRGYVYTVAFHPDGRWVASAGKDQVIRIWEADTGREVLVLPGHDAPVYRVAFSPDGQRLASVGGDGCLRVWDVTLATKE
jgi:WD40 repeat protein